MNRKCVQALFFMLVCCVRLWVQDYAHPVCVCVCVCAVCAVRFDACLLRASMFTSVKLCAICGCVCMCVFVSLFFFLLFSHTFSLFSFLSCFPFLSPEQPLGSWGSWAARIAIMARHFKCVNSSSSSSSSSSLSLFSSLFSFLYFFLFLLFLSLISFSRTIPWGPEAAERQESQAWPSISNV